MNINFTCSLKELDTLYDKTHEILWCYMKPSFPCYTVGLLQDLLAQFQKLQRFSAPEPLINDTPLPLKYVVNGSRLSGIFNYGGNLQLFTKLIARQDRAKLLDYARLCIDVQYLIVTSFDIPVTTIALVEGNALGGGFEMALANDMIIAEKQTKFGMTEAIFNLFPGMGAYSFLSRRLGTVEAEKIIFSGKVYGATELHEMGIVDILAEKGKGKETLLDYIQSNQKKSNKNQALFRIRRKCNPISYKELLDITTTWVDTALKLSSYDLRRMEKLAAAQTKKFTGKSLISTQRYVTVFKSLQQ